MASGDTDDTVQQRSSTVMSLTWSPVKSRHRTVPTPKTSNSDWPDRKRRSELAIRVDAPTARRAVVLPQVPATGGWATLKRNALLVWLPAPSVAVTVRVCAPKVQSSLGGWMENALWPLSNV